MDPYNFTYEKFTYTYNSLSLKNFTLAINSKTLFDNSSLALNYGQCYGLIGKNGYGKSSLLKQFDKLCSINDTLDEQNSPKAYNIRILYVEQELILDERTPVQYILDTNIKMKFYQDRVNLLQLLIEQDDDFDKDIFYQLEEAENNLSSYNIDREEALINKILFGLGFTKETLEQKSNIFSGGWQMRLSLARSLYLEPDLLLLDEPTNHLDLEAIIWLGDYLLKWKKIAVIVSHNIGFLNNVCSNIMNIENTNLITYRGNYYCFKHTFNKKIIEMLKNYEKYEKKIKEFKKKKVTKNDLDEFKKKHYVIRPEKEYGIEMNFFPVHIYNYNIIKVDNVSFSYEEKIILNDISFGMDMKSRITLVGLNGSGKSTLIKLLSNEIKPTSGTITISNGIKIGYYNQHFEQQLPFNKTPIEFLLNIISDDCIDKYATIRNYLGKIKLESSAHNKKICELSGGQKARVAFIKLIFDKPHILLLDEPTNHLDIETVEVLIESLENYQGGILLITHEPELINKLDTNIWIMNGISKKIEFYNDSYDSYCKKIIG